jgi:hypothetical protein
MRSGIGDAESSCVHLRSDGLRSVPRLTAALSAAYSRDWGRLILAVCPGLAGRPKPARHGNSAVSPAIRTPLERGVVAVRLTVADGDDIGNVRHRDGTNSTADNRLTPFRSRRRRSGALQVEAQAIGLGLTESNRSVPAVRDVFRPFPIYSGAERSPECRRCGVSPNGLA